MTNPSENPFHQVRVTGDAPILLLTQVVGSGAKGKAMHIHPEGQFYFATQGLMIVETAAGNVIMPPGRLGWIPPMMPHGATVIGNTKSFAPEISVGFTLYLLPSLCQQFPADPAVLTLSPLMRGILDRMHQWPKNESLTDQERRLLDVFIDEVQMARPEPFQLKMPVHRQLSVMARNIADNPASETSIEEWGNQLGMSSRTITRRFREETGMSVAEWRQIARIQKALELLSDGESVTSTAITLGYDSVSSFIALFKRLLGSTPAKFASDYAVI